MDNIEIVDVTAARITLRHVGTGHVFPCGIATGDLVPEPVKEGPGPKDPGDVAADVHAVAERDARHRGLI